MSDDMRFALSNDFNMARWFVAGFLGGVRRALSDPTSGEEFFKDIALELLENENPSMARVLESINEYYVAIPVKQRMQYTGAYAAVDVQGSPELSGIKNPFPSLFAFQFWDGKTPIPPILFGQQTTPVCCSEILLRLESVKVVIETTDPGDDDVVVTALTHGEVMQPSPIPFYWPLDANGEPDERHLDTGEGATPNELMARVRPGQNCRFQLISKVQFWEADLDNIDKLLRKATQELIYTLASKAKIAGIPPSTAGLLEAIIGRLLDALNLRDDEMGVINFELQGQLTNTLSLDKLAWSPPWGNQRGLKHEKIDDNNVRLSSRFKRLDGIWDVSLAVQRICSP